MIRPEILLIQRMPARPMLFLKRPTAPLRKSHHIADPVKTPAEPAARTLCDLLLRRPLGTTASFEAMEESSLKETGNILTSAYLTALSDFLGMMLVPSVPSLVTDYAGAVLTSVSLNYGQGRDIVFCVDTAFRVEGAPELLHGEFVLLPDTVSLGAIFEAIRLA